MMLSVVPRRYEVRMIVNQQGAAPFERGPTRDRSTADALVSAPRTQILRENR
jgi:hypothetical protein